MNDKITLRDALENPIWLMVYLSEPNKKIDVTMSYVELKAIYDLVNAKRMPEARDDKIRKPKTNADRIRCMTDDELAEWFGKIQYDAAYYWAGEDKQKYPYPDGWLDWLKQEAEAVRYEE